MSISEISSGVYRIRADTNKYLTCVNSRIISDFREHRSGFVPLAGRVGPPQGLQVRGQPPQHRGMHNPRNAEFDETRYFRYIRTFAGRLEPVDFARRNGRLVPNFSPEHTEADPGQGVRSDLKPLLRELMYALNRTERRTWLLLLLGYSIVEIARKERVSRPAIYARIRGNRKKQGGMIRKNEYVAIWWRNQRNGQSNDKSV